MLKKLNVEESFGFRLGFETGPNLTFFDIGVHYHPSPKNGTVIEGDDACQFRWGVYFTILNFRFTLGSYWAFFVEDKK